MCDWYAKCKAEPFGWVEHPVLDLVATCVSCAMKHDLDFVLTESAERPCFYEELHHEFTAACPGCEKEPNRS